MREIWVIERKVDGKPVHKFWQKASAETTLTALERGMGDFYRLVRYVPAERAEEGEK